MGVGAGLYMYVVVVQKFTFAISSPDEFLYFFLLSFVTTGHFCTEQFARKLTIFTFNSRLSFWANVCKTVHHMLSVCVCLVPLVYCGQTVAHLSYC